MMLARAAHSERWEEPQSTVHVMHIHLTIASVQPTHTPAIHPQSTPNTGPPRSIDLIRALRRLPVDDRRAFDRLSTYVGGGGITTPSSPRARRSTTSAPTTRLAAAAAAAASPAPAPTACRGRGWGGQARAEP